MKKVSVLTVCAAIFLLSMCLAVFCACDRAPAYPEIPDEIEERGDFSVRLTAEGYHILGVNEPCEQGKLIIPEIINDDPVVGIDRLYGGVWATNTYQK